MAQMIKFSRCNQLILSNFRTNARNFCNQAKQQPTTTTASTDNNNNPMSKGTYKVDNFEKKLLVWFGKYKNADEIPGYVSQEVVDRARNRFRIRVANIMMILTLIGCGIMIVSGRNAAERGDSVLKSNQDWHREYNERAQKEALEAQAAQKKN
ncbi:hypothetical protein PVAND_011163 [Polypedilum vanderplanki]|uniref:Uncharacterized protein n=1 Tax=Polypedilum vanderplanki TaxID=319348 RepID=A0A9J6CHR6_POLVA|nr:hypothetical protein PVAND_011163 [Polypedilum vanderplanki]